MTRVHGRPTDLDLTQDLPAPPPPTLALEHVTKHFGEGGARRLALDDISLAVHPGELVAVMGPSGAGKSTLVQIACGVERADEGRVLLDGSPAPGYLQTWEQRRRQMIGVVYQRLNLVPTLSAVENVMTPLLLDGVRVGRARPQALDALDQLGVAHLADERPDHLSGGQEQRVAIARAIIGDRRLILADEPTGALDTVSGEEVVRLLADRAARGAAVVLVTHDAGLASWADRVVVLRDGAITRSLASPALHPPMAFGPATGGLR